VISLTEQQILQWLYAYLLPLFRIAAFVAIVPILSTKSVPKKIKLLFVFLLTVAISPGITVDVDVDPISFEMFILIIQQILIGLSMGFALQIVFAAVVNGGQLVGMQMGLGFAQMMDPQTGVNVPVISQFYNLMAILVFLALDGHLILIEMIAESFQILPIGGGGVSPKGFYELVEYGLWVFKGALMVALPVVISLLLINMVMGVITRATPQMNIFAVGFAITIVGGFVLMFATLHVFAEQFQLLLEQTLPFMTDLIVK